MKNVLVDISKIKDLFTGLGQFSINFAEEFSNYYSKDFNISFLIARNTHIESINKMKNVQIKYADFQKRYFPNFNRNYDVWHSLQQFPSFLPNKNTKQILTVHDLNFLEEKSKEKSKKYISRLQKNIDRADIVSVISNYTKSILLQNINLRGKEIHTIYNGVKYNTKEPNGLISKFAKLNKFFFSISVFKAKKNFEVLLPIMKYFPDTKLIIAGNSDTNYGDFIRTKIKELKLENQVMLIGKVSDNEKSWLYSNCTAFLFPSLAEGFGLPVIEAMQYGKPIFLSRFCSLPEIGGKYATYFDSFETANMVNTIKQEMTVFDDCKKEKIKNYANKYNWKNCIEQYVELYKL